MVPASETPGTVLTITATGAAVLAGGSNGFELLATDPGANQGLLVSFPLILVVVDSIANCNAADLAEPFGILDLSDVDAFTAGFVAGDPLADLSDDSLLDLTDIDIFIAAFTGGCP